MVTLYLWAQVNMEEALKKLSQMVDIYFPVLFLESRLLTPEVTAAIQAYQLPLR